MRRPTVLYLLLALAWCWPLPLHLANRFTHDPGDPLLVTYLMWWNAHAVPLTEAWWNAPFFFPLRDALAVTEHLAGLAPLTTPIQWLGGSPLLAYNLVLIASNWWCALATHALVKRLTGSVPAAACAAVAFTYAPYRTSQLGHLQLYTSWWLPVILYALHRYMDEGRARWLAAFGASWMLQGLTNGYSLFFVPILIAGWTVWFTPWRSRPGRFAGVAAAALAFSLPLLPVLLKYYEVQSKLGLTRPRSEMMFYSARWSSFLSASPEMAFWRGTPSPTTTECYLFPGVTAVTLLVLGLAVHPRNRAFAFYVAATIVTALLALGPTADGLSLASLWHPYDLLAPLPGFSGLRVPTRFYLLSVLCLAIAAGMALSFILPRIRWPRAALALVFAGLLADGAIAGMPLGVPPGRFDHVERGARLLSLPADDVYASINAMYRSIDTRMTVVNGYGGYVPVTAYVTQWALERRDPTILTELGRGHPLFVVVTTSDNAAEWEQFLEAQPGVDDFGVSGGGRVYRLPPAAYAAELPQGRRLDGIAVAQTPDALVADLRARRIVRGVEVFTNKNLTLLPEAIHVEVSDDGQDWQQVYDRRPGGAALLGAQRDPLLVPLKLDFPETTARFVRVNVPRLRAGALAVLGE